MNDWNPSRYAPLYAFLIVLGVLAVVVAALVMVLR